MVWNSRTPLVVATLLIACGVALLPAQRRGGRQDADGTRGGRAAATVAVPNGTVVTRDLAYVSDGDRQQTLDLYVPRSRTPPSLIVVVHGGAWRAETSPPTIRHS